LSGKKLEVPVKRILLGASPDKVASAESLLDPQSLAPFLAMARAGLLKDAARGQ
jgi:acetoacetyl-CoA synthetase